MDFIILWLLCYLCLRTFYPYNKSDNPKVLGLSSLYAFVLILFNDVVGTIIKKLLGVE